MKQTKFSLTHPRRPRSSELMESGRIRERGVALIIVLSFMVLIAAVILAFFSSALTEHSSSSSYAANSEGKRLGDKAVQVVVGQIREATSSGTSVAWASQPGMIRTYGEGGAASAKPLALYKLYSSDKMVVSSDLADFKLEDEVPGNWASAPALYSDLNAPVKSYSGEWSYPILDPRAADAPSGSTSPLVEGFSITNPPGYDAAGDVSAKNNRAPMPVKWLYFLKDGTLTAPSGVSADGKTATWANMPVEKTPSDTNPIVARVAFWTDDESCKLNLNTAAGGNPWESPMFCTGLDVESSVYQPAVNEFARFPGHPASVSLQPVLWSFGGLPSPDYSLYPSFAPAASDPVSSDKPYDLGKRPSPHEFSSTIQSYFQRLFNLAPRNAFGGSLSGPTSSIGGSGIKAADLDADRLYASVDEALYFNPSPDKVRTSRSGTNSEEFELSPSDLEKVRFFLTTNSRAPEVNMFNLPKVAMWPIDDETLKNPANPTAPADQRSPLDKLIAFCATLNGKGYYFSRNDPTSGTADFPAGDPNAATGVKRNGILYSYLEGLLGEKIPGFGATFQSRYNSDGCKEILTECFDYIRSCINLLDGSGPVTAFDSSGAPLKGKPFLYAFTKAPVDDPTTVINLKDPNKFGWYPQTGQVTPIQNGSNSTKGIGRFPTIKQVAIMFIARAANQPPVLVDKNGKPLDAAGNVVTTGGTCVANPMHLWVKKGSGEGPGPGATPILTGSVGSFAVNVPNRYPSLSGTTNITHPGMEYLSDLNPVTGAYDVKNANYDITTGTALYTGPTLPYHATQMDVMLILDPVDVASGNTGIRPEYRVKISGLNKLKVNGAAISGFRPTDIQTIRGNRGVQDYNLGRALHTWGRTASGSYEHYLSFYGKVAQVTANPIESPFGETFSFTGAELTIEIGTVDPATPNIKETVQTLHVKFPDGRFPTPLLPWGDRARHVDGTKAYAGGPDRFYLTFNKDDPIGGGDSRNGIVAHAPGGVTSMNGSFFDVALDQGGGGNGYKQTSDTIRAMECIYGDTRTISALKNVPAPFFIKNRYYDDTDVRAAHSFRGAGEMDDVYFSKFPGMTETASALGSLADWNPIPAANVKYYDVGDNTKDSYQTFLGLPAADKFSVFPASLGFSTAPHVTSSAYFGDISGDFTAIWGSGIAEFRDIWTQAGDFDNGMSFYPDGPYINKANEGAATFKVATGDVQVPDFFNGKSDVYNLGGAIFSPNRQVSSPVMFGSLPIGSLTPGSPVPDGTTHFWRTLLFCPNPNSPTHASLGGNPPDYAFLDFFNMPIVEPYALSEPFSTAGRVNMNYQIAPFTYIKRDTALRGVLHSVLLTAVPDKWIGAYKTVLDTHGSYFGVKSSLSGAAGLNSEAANSGFFTFRYPIHAGETLKQFDSKFDNGEIFKSPSEICGIWLYPAKQPSDPLNPATALVSDDIGSVSNIKNWWYNDPGKERKSLTGDNMRERPYAALYPQLTTKSNTFTVHYHVQVLKKVKGTDSAVWTEGKDKVQSEYRGSTLIERYIDPNSADLPDFAIDKTKSLDEYYHFRTLSSRRFAP